MNQLKWLGTIEIHFEGIINVKYDRTHQSYAMYTVQLFTYDCFNY